MHWLWNDVYKGVSIEWDGRVRGMRWRRGLWLGWTTRRYRRLGW